MHQHALVIDGYEFEHQLLAAKGFVVLPRRWVVERTLGWMGRNRRLSKDYEETIPSSEAMVKLSMIHLMGRRLARKVAS